MKKFGKLGDAVVVSNMEVMTKGFELVREIKVGEMEAADRLDAARQGAAADGHARQHRGQRGVQHGCRTIPPPEDQPARPPLTRVADFDAMFSGEAGLQPAGQCVRVARHHGGGQRRHGVEVRRAPRDAALYS